MAVIREMTCYVLRCDSCRALWFLGRYKSHMPVLQLDAYQVGWRRHWDGDHPTDLCPPCLAAA
jgi:hypothetical protein